MYTRMHKLNACKCRHRTIELIHLKPSLPKSQKNINELGSVH